MFSNTWQLAARTDQVTQPGQYVTTDVAGEPIVVVRGNDRVLRAFFNVCRHHAAAVMTEPEGKAAQLRCPYHGWTYSLEGELKGTPDFSGVAISIARRMDLRQLRSSSGRIGFSLNSMQVRLAFTTDLTDQIRALQLNSLHWFERRYYNFDCNWKVFVDNYLDGGYHVPYLHKGLDSVLDYSNYMIENGERHCLQWSLMVSAGAEAQTGRRATRRPRALLLDLSKLHDQLVRRRAGYELCRAARGGPDRSHFRFLLSDVVSEEARQRNLASVEVGQRIQDEDVAICKSVQRGLNSRAYNAGRLSVRREAGEHLFHRLLLHADLSSGNTY